MALWHRWLDFPWHSDHLAFHVAAHHQPDEGDINVNLTLPPPEPLTPS